MCSSIYLDCWIAKKRLFFHIFCLCCAISSSCASTRAGVLAHHLSLYLIIILRRIFLILIFFSFLRVCVGYLHFFFAQEKKFNQTWKRKRKKVSFVAPFWRDVFGYLFRGRARWCRFTLDRSGVSVCVCVFEQYLWYLTISIWLCTQEEEEESHQEKKEEPRKVVCVLCIYTSFSSKSFGLFVSFSPCGVWIIQATSLRALHTHHREAKEQVLLSLLYAFYDAAMLDKAGQQKAGLP